MTLKKQTNLSHMLINIKCFLAWWLKKKSITLRMTEGCFGCGEQSPCLLNGLWISYPLLQASFLENGISHRMHNTRSEPNVNLGLWWWRGSGVVTDVTPGCRHLQWGAVRVWERGYVGTSCTFHSILPKTALKIYVKNNNYNWICEPWALPKMGQPVR